MLKKLVGHIIKKTKSKDYKITSKTRRIKKIHQQFYANSFEVKEP